MFGRLRRHAYFRRPVLLTVYVQGPLQAALLNKKRKLKMAIALTGKIMGSVTSHTPETLKAVFEKAYAVLPLSDG